MNEIQSLMCFYAHPETLPLHLKSKIQVTWDLIRYKDSYHGFYHRIQSFKKIWPTVKSCIHLMITLTDDWNTLASIDCLNLYNYKHKVTLQSTEWKSFSKLEEVTEVIQSWMCPPKKWGWLVQEYLSLAADKLQVQWSRTHSLTHSQTHTHMHTGRQLHDNCVNLQVH